MQMKYRLLRLTALFTVNFVNREFYIDTASILITSLQIKPAFT